MGRQVSVMKTSFAFTQSTLRDASSRFMFNMVRQTHLGCVLTTPSLTSKFPTTESPFRKDSLFNGREIAAQTFDDA